MGMLDKKFSDQLYYYALVDDTVFRKDHPMTYRSVYEAC